MRTQLQLTTPAETRRLKLARACTVRFSRAHRGGVCNRVCNRVHGGVHTTSQPASRPCQTRCNRALSRLRQPPGLTRHDLDSPTQRAHSCSWSLRLKHDGSHGRTRARRCFHVRTGCAHTDVCNRVHGGVHQPVCVHVHQPVVCNQPTSCVQNPVQPSVAAVPATSRAVRTRSE